MSENEASNGSSKSSDGPSSGSSRLDSAISGSSGGTNSSSSGLGPSVKSTESSSVAQHSVISSLKMSTCGTSTTDSAYGGSNTQRSGSGSRSSKSQISSNSSNNAGVEQPKPRKDKEQKKRKSKATVPPLEPSVDRPASAEPNKGASASAAALITAASTAVASVCSTSTVEGGLGVLVAPGPVDSGCLQGGTAAAGATGAASSSGLSMGGRTKLPRAGCGIRGVTESRAVQAAALTRALDCLKDNTCPSSSKDARGLSCPKEGTASPSWRSILMDPMEASLKKTFAHLEEVPAVKSKEAFIAAISLQDGIVVYVTPSLTDRLGYPAEMWCGRSLLDFIHPKDRLAFTNQITSKLLASLDKDDASSYSFASDDGMLPRGMFGSSSSPPNMLCSRLRMYRGLRTSGFGIVDKKTSYLPFRINLVLEKIKLPGDSRAKKEAQGAEDVPATEEADDDSESEYYLLAYAVPISSAYKAPEETDTTGQFGLRHSANCLFSEVDLSSVPYLGHLPQDLLGTSALEYYHPNDLPELKKIYDSVIGRQGKSIRSKPYNFRAFNGCYVLLETDWTCFVNPWTKKLEFVAGHHRVLKGPSNPDVFANPPEGSSNLLDSMDPAAAETAKKLHAEICTILTGSPKPPQQHRHNRVDAALLETATRRRKNLATLMGSLIDEVARVRGSNSGGNSSSSSYTRGKPLVVQSPVEGSFLGDASVVMGDISTHGGSGADSNSADSPLSYSLLNYNQNLERYFQSQPKMMPSDGSGESSGNGSGNGSAGSKPDTNRTPNTSSEEEGGFQGNADSSGTVPSSDSQKLSSSKSPSKSLSSDSQNSIAYDSEFKGLPLTKETLVRHNEAMEKEFMQQHRELKHRSSLGRRSGQYHRKEPHGVKRGQASSWEDQDGLGGRHKHPHMDGFCATPVGNQSMSTATTPGNFTDWASPIGRSVIPASLLPPFSVSGPSPSHQHSAAVSMPSTCRAEVTSALPALYLAQGALGASSGRPTTTTAMHPHPYHMLSSQQPLAPTYSLQPYAFPQGIFYQPVMVPPMLFQPGLGMMIPASPMAPQRVAPRPRFPGNERFQMPGEQPTSESSSDYPPTTGSLSNPTSSEPRILFKRTPPWMEAVTTTPQLIYQYQLPGRSAMDVLEADRERLRILQQPTMLNHQLEQLYTEMDAEDTGGHMAQLALDEGENSTSSSSTAAEDSTNTRRRELRRRSAEFRRTMLYEENAPFPRPVSSPND